MIFFAEESVSCAGVCLHYVVDDVVAVAVDLVVLVPVVVVAAVFVAAVVVAVLPLLSLPSLLLLLLLLLLLSLLSLLLVVPRERTVEILIVRFLLFASIDSVDLPR